MKDYYQILGVGQDASPEEIKKAFHKLAHKYHPLKGGDEKKFKEINEAYQILGNPEKRTQYDRFGRIFEGVGSGADWPGAGWPGAGGFGGGFDFGFDFDSLDIEDIFEDLFDLRKRGQRKNINQGKDIEVELEIDLKETLENFKKTITLAKKVVCPRCQGSAGEPGTKTKECFSCRGKGEVQQMKKIFFGTITQYVICPQCKGEGKIPEKPCNVCQGEGRVDEKETIEVSIPAGVDSGQTLKFSGQGDAGRRGARSGNLYLKIFVRPHPLFKRRGDDLYLSLPISFSQAVLGDEVEVPTLDGKNIFLRIPAGTESGKIFRISKKGIPHFSGFGRGSLYVELFIKTPKNLTKKQKELLNKLREEGI